MVYYKCINSGILVCLNNPSSYYCGYHLATYYYSHVSGCVANNKNDLIILSDLIYKYLRYKL